MRLIQQVPCQFANVSTAFIVATESPPRNPETLRRSLNAFLLGCTRINLSDEMHPIAARPRVGSGNLGSGPAPGERRR